MIKHKNYNSYHKDIMSVYDSTPSSFSVEQSTNETFKNILSQFLLSKVKESWEDFESNKRESYYLTDKEFDSVFKEAELEMTFKSITKLSNLGFVKASIRADGEVVYSLTEEGKHFVESIDQYL